MIFNFMLCFIFLSGALAEASVWAEDYVFSGESRPNPLNVSELQIDDYIKKGLIHTQKYPVITTGVLLPERPLRESIEGASSNIFKSIFINIFKSTFRIESFNDLFYWLGLLDYPMDESKIPYPESSRPDYLLGYSRINIEGTDLFTMSCATCHSGQLFGNPVLGMSKRFPRANEFFIKGVTASKYYESTVFKKFTGATEDELFYLERSLKNLNAVGLKMPQVIGLDTSLAQVALSLNKRESDEWATQSDHFEHSPRPDVLDHEPGDSKPAVWWNLKYKTRWLSDGSVVSGNPVVTNILWNEIGRGSDLKELQNWIETNDQKIKELTTAIFSINAPRIENYFKASSIDENKALAGEKLFNNACSKCHGTYTKNWSVKDYDDAPWAERIKNYKVDYPKPTKVVDVGTDPYRYTSMKSLEKLNRLKISKDYGVVIKSQKGYVPPPLVGVWARWPYLHNNSIPNLCALMTPPDERPKTFLMGEAIDKNKDFDFECNGYPLDFNAPLSWVKNEVYQTEKKGLSNSGHYKKIFTDKKGNEKFTQDEKTSLIQFMQTL